LQTIDDDIDLADALRALAFMGDLSMGQPVDHSPRVAWLACQLARSIGLDASAVDDVASIAMLRWSGCTANATDVAATISDDVAGRAAMLALQPGNIKILVSPEVLADRLVTISAVHCEVSSIIADTLGLNVVVSQSLRCVFENWDGSGQPSGVSGDAIPTPALVVAVTGDLEVLARVHGIPAALALLRQRAGLIYPRELVETVCEQAVRWLSQLEEDAQDLFSPQPDTQRQVTSLDVVGDVIDLKLPWLMGHSRAVSGLADSIAATLNLPAATRRLVRRAGWLQGLGRVAVPNAVWNRSGALTGADWERVRLSPYWTARAAKQIRPLEREADIASHAFERLDGSGYFRGSRHGATPLEHRILPVALAWVSMRSDRPWRDALPADVAMEHLRQDVTLGRLDQRVLDALTTLTPSGRKSPGRGTDTVKLLSARELDVLTRVSLGDSNKSVAIRLNISPSTVRTHLESIFRKLECNSRAAATLKAALLGLLGT
jgi:HD-GYP domain-containing protein (c-di-GMP phosphodiesterase class II)/DNA-binding CsgD family transcriptional regulator